MFYILSLFGLMVRLSWVSRCKLNNVFISLCNEEKTSLIAINLIIINNYNYYKYKLHTYLIYKKPASSQPRQAQYLIPEIHIHKIFSKLKMIYAWKNVYAKYILRIQLPLHVFTYSVISAYLRNLQIWDT